MNKAARLDSDRMEELEARLRDLEARRRRGGAWFRRLIPPEATQHFRAAGREQLLGMRVLVDHWIHRLEDSEPPAGARSGREEITIE